MNSPVLEKLLFPITIDDFFEQYWKKKVLHIPRNQTDYYQDYLSEEEINTCFKRGNLTYPNLHLRKNGGNVSSGGWTYQQQNKQYVDETKLLPYLQSGHAIVAKQFHEHSPPLTSLIDDLKSFFTAHLIKDYLIISRPSNASFNIHYDREHVIVIQVAGTKQWHFYDTHSPYLRSEKVKFGFDPEPSLSITMKPGDFLYLPHNLRHSTEVADERTAISLSITIDPPNGVQLLRHIVDNSFAHVPALREKMPLYNRSTKADRQQYYQQLKDRFITHLNTLDFEELFHEYDHIQKKEKGRIDLTQEIIPSVTLDSTLIRNKVVNYSLKSDRKILILKVLDEVNVYYKLLELSLKYILAQEQFTVRNIPGLITDDIRVELSQELVNIGLFEHVSQ